MAVMDCAHCGHGLKDHTTEDDRLSDTCLGRIRDGDEYVCTDYDH